MTKASAPMTLRWLAGAAQGAGVDPIADESASTGHALVFQVDIKGGSVGGIAWVASARGMLELDAAYGFDFAGRQPAQGLGGQGQVALQLSKKVEAQFELGTFGL